MFVRIDCTHSLLVTEFIVRRFCFTLVETIGVSLNIWVHACVLFIFLFYRPEETLCSLGNRYLIKFDINNFVGPSSVSISIRFCNVTLVQAINWRVEEKELLFYQNYHHLLLKQNASSQAFWSRHKCSFCLVWSRLLLVPCWGALWHIWWEAEIRSSNGPILILLLSQLV